jgi:hypothetical protein
MMLLIGAADRDDRRFPPDGEGFLTRPVSPHEATDDRGLRNIF